MRVSGLDCLLIQREKQKYSKTLTKQFVVYAALSRITSKRTLANLTDHCQTGQLARPPLEQWFRKSRCWWWIKLLEVICLSEHVSCEISLRDVVSVGLLQGRSSNSNLVMWVQSVHTKAACRHVSSNNIYLHRGIAWRVWPEKKLHHCAWTVWITAG